ncbi:MAG: hypothetical protein ACO3C1_07445 [Ilumatobacteraceae bacterium]
MSSATSPRVRADLALAHRRSFDHIVSAGSRFTGAQRRRIAEVARDAYLTADPPPPWERPYGEPLLDGAYRLARHAGTLTEQWYERLLAEGIDALEWVEVVGIVCAVVPPVAFARAIGVSLPVLPEAVPGAPTRLEALEVVAADLNWVPVAAPADRTASVVQALSALPAEWNNLWQLAAAQYMSDRQMDDPTWTRGTLSRPQMELVAGRLSLIRECFF